MMTILIDTNVIIDYLCDRKPFSDAADSIFKLSETDSITVYISSVSIPNIIYILRKELDNGKIQNILNIIYMVAKVYDVSSNDLKQAAKLDFDDYEDAIQSISAYQVKADYIVSRNCKDFYNSNVKAISPFEFLNAFYNEK